MLETVVTIILIPIAFGAIAITGAMLVGFFKCFKRNK